MAIEDRLEELFMNDSNNRRVTSVNTPQRPSPWRGGLAFAGVAAIAGIVLVAVILGLRDGQQTAAPTATAIPSATSTAASTPTPTAIGSVTPVPLPTYQSPVGYSVQLPAGWRRSDLQSRTTPFPQGDPDQLAFETFTTRTPADEAAQLPRSDTGLGPAQFYTARVALFRNSRNETAMAYAERVKAGSGLIAVSIEPTTVDGRAGVKTTFKFTTSDTQSFYTLYIPDADRMWVIGYALGSTPGPSGAEIPPGATEPAVRSIVESFRFAR